MKAYSLDFRKKIIDTYFKEGTSQRKLANRFGVALSFIEKLLKQQRETGDLAPKPHGGGRTPKLNAAQRALVAELVEADNDATLEELCEQLQQRTTITLSRSTMGRILQQLKLTRKKKTLHASEKDTPRVQQARLDYWEKVRDINPEDLVFVDESGLNLAMTRLYARSPQAERAIGDRPQQRGQTVSIVDALTLYGPIAVTTILGPMDGLTFTAYLVRRVIPNLWSGACLVLDNNPTHHENEEIKTALEAVGAQLVYLSPYSPDFSPIEPFWSKVKAILESIGARMYQALEDGIKSAYQKVSLQDIRNWFTNCCYSEGVTKVATKLIG
jgi:transposase